MYMEEVEQRGSLRKWTVFRTTETERRKDVDTGR